jgi:hypothetical protein
VAESSALEPGETQLGNKCVESEKKRSTQTVGFSFGKVRTLLCFITHTMGSKKPEIPGKTAKRVAERETQKEPSGFLLG